jgi:hypothetical protein
MVGPYSRCARPASRPDPRTSWSRNATLNSTSMAGTVSVAGSLRSGDWGGTISGHFHGPWLCRREEHGLERFTRAFAEAGFVVLLHDHRNFGSGDGAVWHDIDPWRQIADRRRAISFLESLPEVDAAGSAPGEELRRRPCARARATDRRIRAVVSQVPTVAPPRWSASSMRTSAHSFAASRSISSIRSVGPGLLSGQGCHRLLSPARAMVSGRTR